MSGMDCVAREYDEGRDSLNERESLARVDEVERYCLAEENDGWDSLARKMGGWGYECLPREDEEEWQSLKGGRGCSRRGGRYQVLERGRGCGTSGRGSLAQRYPWGRGFRAREDRVRISESLEREDGEEWESLGREDGEGWKIPTQEMSGWNSPAREDGDVPLSPEHENDKSAGRNRIEHIQSLQSSLKSAFDDMEADLVRAERKKKELRETIKKLKEELNRAKEGEESGKQNLEQTRSKLRELAERNKKLEEELRGAKEREESSKRLEEELKRVQKGEESSKHDLEQTRNKLWELCTTFAAVKEECDKVCDQQGAAPQLSKKRKYVLKVLEVNDLLNCSICWERWTQTGEHTVCSLSCGHFFGKSCITQWIVEGDSRGSSTCPVCSRIITLSDIRHHYISQVYEA